MKNNPKYIIVHCSDVSENTIFDQFDSINKYHRDERGFPVSSLGYYVGYHSLITGNNNYKCKLDSDEGAHCNQLIDGVSLNFQSLGVCIGFDGDIEYPSVTHYNLLQKQIWDWQDKYNIPNTNVLFHRKFATSKTCPGSLLGDSWLKQLLTRPVKLPPVNTVPTSNCTELQNKVIIQEGIINNLKSLLQSIISMFNKK